jgi:phospholipid/cholesterol/gamma-HCH transport system substrate-binding protein
MIGRKIGILAIVTIAVSVLGYFYISNKGIFNDTTKLYVFIDDPTGISTKSPILINGFEIGKVSNLEIINNEVLLELSVDGKLGISRESQLVSAPSSFLGGKQINLENYDQNDIKYKSGDTIKSQVITKSLTEAIDPELKKLSSTIGAALLEYGESTEVNEEVIDFTCSFSDNNHINSELANKVNRLYNLDNKYKLIEDGQFQIEESNLIQGFKRYIENAIIDNHSVSYSITENFNSSIISMNYAYVKGEKDLGNRLYARARIDEYVFKSDECAELFDSNLKSVLQDDRAWYEIDKAPTSIYLEENRVYFIATGGWYMKPFYKEIVNEFKNRQRNTR